jgi:hypothetical protein
MILNADWNDQGDILLSEMTLETSTTIGMIMKTSTLSIMITETSTLSGMRRKTSTTIRMTMETSTAIGMSMDSSVMITETLMLNGMSWKNSKTLSRITTRILNNLGQDLNSELYEHGDFNAVRYDHGYLEPTMKNSTQSGSKMEKLNWSMFFFYQ